MTSSIKKAINTELFIDRKRGLYIKKWLGTCSGKIEEVKMYWRENEWWNVSGK